MILGLILAYVLQFIDEKTSRALRNAELVRLHQVVANKDEQIRLLLEMGATNIGSRVPGSVPEPMTSEVYEPDGSLTVFTPTNGKVESDG